MHPDCLFRYAPKPAGDLWRSRRLRRRDYTVQVTSTVELGMAANSGDVSKKADELQRKRIAFELAKKIRADRQSLLSILGK